MDQRLFISILIIIFFLLLVMALLGPSAEQYHFFGPRRNCRQYGCTFGKCCQTGYFAGACIDDLRKCNDPNAFTAKPEQQGVCLDSPCDNNQYCCYLDGQTALCVNHPDSCYKAGGTIGSF